MTFNNYSRAAAAAAVEEKKQQFNLPSKIN